MLRKLLPHFAWLALGLAMLASAVPAAADPADIDAAARGVVRVVVIGRDGERIFVVSHGTGFAVAPEKVVTNAHVVAEARENRRLSLGIVPSDGGDAVFARLVSVSSRNDLALLETTAPMQLPPLSISGNPATDAGAVTAVGFPQNVDRAQGLDMDDLFRAQPPVKSLGFLSGRRPSREFDTLLHTAPIARGSSGGPLLDECGRVVGVNSFGAQSAGTDAEFFFAVSNRELLPFLRANDVTPRINALPCRSLVELEEAERARAEQRRAAAEAEAASEERALARSREEARRRVEFAVLEERDNLMGLAFALLIVALGAGAAGWRVHERRGAVAASDPAEFDAGEEPEARIAAGTWAAGGIALAALAGSAVAWLSRPGFAEIDARLEDELRAGMIAGERGTTAEEARAGVLVCRLDEARSRVIGAAEAALELEWRATGCVNERTQYALIGGSWTRVFVPASEAAVSVNRFDSAAGEFVIERYLLGREAMRAVREARAGSPAPDCAASPEEAREVAGDFGARQAELIARLPDRPNERLVYECASPG